MDRSWRRAFLAGFVALGLGVAGSLASREAPETSCPIARAQACVEAPLAPMLERVAWGLVKHALS
jgi:hypothetical protein